MKFSRHIRNPVIPRSPGTFGSIHMANPDLLEFNNRLFLYFRGQGEEQHDQIGLAYTEPEKFDGINWIHYDRNPIVKVSKKREDFDSRHILDPASAVIDGRVYLYYSGHSYDKPPGIGLAVSDDGYNFIKSEVKPVMENAFAPEVILKDGTIHLFYQRKVNDHFEFFVCTSKDGMYFDMSNEKNIFKPTFDAEKLDGFSVTTCRIWLENGIYFMTYGMCDKFDDYPPAFGLAKSNDLMNWERYPGNPIYTRGEPGSWDEGAIWFGTVYKHFGKYYMWYEGTGAGLGTDSMKAIKASDICRNNDYGGYAGVSFSQIGLATYKGVLPSW